MRKKALLAIAFASGLINPSAPAIAEEPTSTPLSIIEKVAGDEVASPEARGFHLLKIASLYLAGKNSNDIALQYNNKFVLPWRSYYRSKRFDTMLAAWARELSAEEAKDFSINSKSRTFANTAITQALPLIEKAPDSYARLNLYYIASRLFEISGNKDGWTKCNNLLTDSFRTCEDSKTPSPEEIKAAASVLDSMAYHYVPILLPDLQPQVEASPKQTQQRYGEDKLEKSTKLRLRAVAMADRLDPTENVRRKAHRDMSLWYKAVGNEILAEKEKQKLFDLVGSADDSLLYAQKGACGSLTWWTVPSKKAVVSVKCGMG